MCEVNFPPDRQEEMQVRSGKKPKCCSLSYIDLKLNRKYFARVILKVWIIIGQQHVIKILVREIKMSCKLFRSNP